MGDAQRRRSCQWRQHQRNHQPGGEQQQGPHRIQALRRGCHRARADNLRREAGKDWVARLSGGTP